ncbi:hemagglutinin repeat-containing protein, partial [Chelativorans alearense]|uniref:hemagglutinin repeat-containing protein n=1 Tax=Chelativorans alearense TaxID=2681495 RepID=UPI0013D47AE2
MIVAGGDVSLKSGRDTALLGGNIEGRRVAIDAGRDLAVLSPQAQGWRDGYSFGLTIGWNPASFGIRGSKEDGSKAWSSGSSIVAEELIDISASEDTVLNGALLHATDGDIRIDTGTLTVTDNRDHDQYRNIGGSLGFNAGGLDTAGFSYEEKDKRGETRTTLDAAGELDVTIRDADRDGTPGTAADQRAAQEQLAAINKDAGTWQEITRDRHTRLSGELNVTNLRELG